MKRLFPGAARSVACGEKTWHNIQGPMEATIAVLLGLGWTLESMLVWEAPTGQRFSVPLAARSNGGQLLNEVRRLAEEQAWRMAARHPLGQGLEGGPPAVCPALEA